MQVSKKVQTRCIKFNIYFYTKYCNYESIYLSSSYIKKQNNKSHLNLNNLRAECFRGTLLSTTAKYPCGPQAIPVGHFKPSSLERTTLINLPAGLYLSMRCSECIHMYMLSLSSTQTLCRCVPSVVLNISGLIVISHWQSPL